MHLLMFDVDGTLTDSYERDGEIYCHVACDVLGIRPHELDTRWGEYRDVTDAGITAQVLERHGRTAEHAESIQRRFVEVLCAETEDGRIREMPGARALLDTIADRPDTQAAIATGAWGGTAVEKLRQAGFDPSELPMASCDDAHARTEIMRIALDRAARAAAVETFETVTYVGDAPWDVEASRELGWPFIGRARGKKADRLRELGVRRIVRDYEDREAFLSAWRAVRAG
jgi:phosphoglycolate phosphatase-like HAD superfamily hydrolase